MRLVLAIAAVSTLAACASMPGGGNDYEAKFTRLSDQCKARGGVLTPTGANRGEPQIDYACTIHGGATRIGD